MYFYTSPFTRPSFLLSVSFFRRSGNETSMSPRLTCGGPGGNRGLGSVCDVGCTMLAGEGGGGPLGASAVAPIISCSNLSGCTSQDRIEHFHMTSSPSRLGRKTENSRHVDVQRDRNFYSKLHKMSDILIMHLICVENTIAT